MKRRLAALFAIAALALPLSACSSDDESSSQDSSTQSSEKKRKHSSRETPTPEETEEAPEVVVSSEGMPTVDTSESIPRIIFPDSEAPAGLQVSVISQGTGDEISKDDFLTVDYVGAVWGADEPFDSSYSRSEPLSMSLTQLITGWAYGLEGCHVGDKVILSIPPEYGYGSYGQPAAGIGGTDTIVFYIDILEKQ